MTRYAEHTDVSSDKSIVEIQTVLRRYGATAFAYGWTRAGANVGFELEDRQMKFHLPLPSIDDERFDKTDGGRKRSDSARAAAYEQAIRQSWRALALFIKAKLEAVAAGITTVEEEFLAHIVLPDGSTFGQWAAPQLERAYTNHQMPALLPGGAS